MTARRWRMLSLIVVATTALAQPAATQRKSVNWDFVLNRTSSTMSSSGRTGSSTSGVLMLVVLALISIFPGLVSWLPSTLVRR